MFRFGKLNSTSPLEFKMGMESGYIYYFKTNPWRSYGGGNVVADMPELKPANFYLNFLTLSMHYKFS